MATNNPGIRTKVMDVLQGFRTIQKIFTAASDATGEIEACMLCQTVAAGAGADSAVTLAKGYDGSGVPYFALNNWFDDDASSLSNTTMGDGSGAGSRIIGVPLTSSVELRIPVAQLEEGATTAYTVGDIVVAGTTDGKIMETTGAAQYIVGQVTKVNADSIEIYPIPNGGTTA